MKYLLLLFLLGCKAEPIVTYRLSKEPSPEATAVGALPAAHREVDWVVPSGWEEQAPSQMRVGSFLIKSPEGKTVDVSVVPLSGAAGGDLSNINRWRGQIQLSPIDEPGLRKEIESIIVTWYGIPG